ncbi:hypothetical protein [Teredinibacter turnerae]|uniref:hypothetical protein n=1 Tax=Teredinibacter turnerae TaxID=2426 RepID=UPI00035EDB62|nr:hypothetical protein [Teredinibacter turnerae]
MRNHISKIEQDETGEYFVVIPEELWAELQKEHDWRVGDEVDIEVNLTQIKLFNVDARARINK